MRPLQQPSEPTATVSRIEDSSAVSLNVEVKPKLTRFRALRTIVLAMAFQPFIAVSMERLASSWGSIEAAMWAFIWGCSFATSVYASLQVYSDNS